MKKIILISCTLILMPLYVFAATINVPGDQPTIQAGIDAAVDGDIVLLADGTYKGSGNFNIDFSGKSITVESVNGSDVCIVDCQGLGRGFLFYNGETETSVLEGLTITNGYVDGDKNGGAIYIYSSLPRIRNCIFSMNRSLRKGGAVFAEFDYSWTDPYPRDTGSFENCIFSNNIAGYGGAVKSEYYNFSNCEFVGNSSLDGFGGAVCCGNSSSFVDCNFNNNTSSVGGAVYADGNETFFARCLFNNNSSSDGGGAVHAQMANFQSCIFRENNTNEDGGAVISWYQNNFNNCLFTHNCAHLGGAIAIFNSTSSNCYCNIVNCSFTLNEANEGEETNGKGGAIWCDIPLTQENPDFLKNCILWGNTASEGSEIYEENKSLVITYSNIQGGYAGEGNVDTDPLFVDVNNDDFHLQETSPCIDTGTADGAPADDLDGNYRPVGSGYDMGAYEYQGPIIIDSFTANPTTGKPSLIVDFTCSAHDDSNTITGYQWNFGDGNSGTTPTGTIQHIYIIPGTFSATCTVVNDNSDQTTASTTIEVTNDIPIADAGADQITPGSSVELNGSASSDPDGTISLWEWTLSHTENTAYNKSASGEIVYLSNLEFGHYTVVLTVTDNFGAQGIDEMFLSIAASTGDVYSQEDLDQTREDGYDQGFLEGMDEGLNNSGNTIAGIIEEGVNGEKIIEGPVIIKGTLVIE